MPGIVEERRPSVQRLLMPPLMWGMTALLVLIGVGMYLRHLSYYDRQMNASRATVSMLYQASVKDHQATLDSLLEAVTTDVRLFPLFARRDADGLERLYGDVFARLRDKRRISSLIFIDTQQCVITDMGHPENRNRIVNRFIFFEAERSGKAVVGLDVGTSGGLTMRMTTPVTHHNVLVGHIEASIDLNDVSGAVSALRTVDMVFALNKRSITGELLPVEGGEQGSPGFWLDVDEQTLAYSPNKHLDKALIRALLQKKRSFSGEVGSDHFSLFYARAYYAVGGLLLTDSLGSPLGSLFIVEDATGIWREYVLTALGLLCVGSVVILACRRFVGRILARTDTDIAGMLVQIYESDIVFENVFKESETGFVIQNWTTGEILRANRVALSIFDADAPEDINLSQLRPVDSRDMEQLAWQCSGDSPLMTIVTGTGTAYCELSHFFLGVNEEMQCVAIRDVTRLVALQKKNRNQIEYLQAIIDQFPGLVVIKDSKYRLTLYNAVFDQIFGEGASMTGKTHFADWLGERMDEMLSLDRATFESGHTTNFEYVLQLRNGEERTFLVSQKVVAGLDDSDNLLCVATDITERSRMEEQLIQLRRKAEEASLAKSQFLARMSHEIRTPMNVILGMSHLALGADPDERQRNYVTKIHGAAKNLLGIINDILDFSKIEAGEMTLENISFSLEELLRDIESGMQPLLADKPVLFTLSLPELENELTGDPLRIRQILLNLVNNAVKFTHEGSISLDCRIREETELACVVEFAVRDTGIGIPEDAMRRLFTSFQQVDDSTTRKYGGTGLGLAISKELALLMGGDITVSSEEGKGSTFTVTLNLLKCRPGVCGDAADGQDEPGQTEGLPDDLSAKLIPEARVLVVEDNEINQEIIIELLEQRHLRVLSANNGQEALAIVEKEDVDLLLMDLQMPVMDGLSATRAIRKLPSARARAVPIVALTANAMLDDREQCLEAGMNDFLSKPIDVSELDAKLLRWLGRQAEEEVRLG